MAQVFDNVIQNAIEAMAEGGGTLLCEWVTIRHHSDHDREACVEFRDTGRGLFRAVVRQFLIPSSRLSRRGQD